VLFPVALNVLERMRWDIPTARQPRSIVASAAKRVIALWAEAAYCREQTMHSDPRAMNRAFLFAVRNRQNRDFLED
jgi:hypothetical protein